MGKYVFTKVINDTPANDTNVAIASAITSYARIKIHELIVDIEKIGGKVYYTDTDSIFCNIKLSDHPELLCKYRKVNKIKLDNISEKFEKLYPEDYIKKVNDIKLLMSQGEWLGGLKNELGLDEYNNDISFDRGLFCGCKMYGIYTNNEEWNKKNEIKNMAVKMKGFKKNDINGITLSSEYLYEVIEKINNNEKIEQEQFQIIINKNDYLTNCNTFNIRYNENKKIFKKIYTKGIIKDDGFIEPFAI